MHVEVVRSPFTESQEVGRHAHEYHECVNVQANLARYEPSGKVKPL